LIVDHQRVDVCEQRGDEYLFRLPMQPGTVRVVSRAAAPQELGLAPDPRSLGVAIRTITLLCGEQRRSIHADDQSLVDGFHGFESDAGFRWTDGHAALPKDLFDGITGSALLSIRLGSAT